MWTEYRNRILDHAGVALFLFGNNEEYGRTGSASGMQQEWEIAHAKGLVLLLVGATGSLAKTLAELAAADNL
ncbi:hypothetical protein [uncultured Sphingopyxis sp.]|uniref:hypothetical protein n=1 Tax=uncultured Sphingopyxis sp. TaxID=310581 RepID=UPI0025EB352C|nr:hypothetical protein [uncultured Sphingopyxis sp.]